MPAHLWFLYILLVFTLLLLPVFLYLRTEAGQQIVDRIASITTRPWMIFLPALPIAVVEAALGTDMGGGWNQSAYLVFLCCGYLLAADARFWKMLRKCWKTSLVLAVVSSAGGIIGLHLIVEGADTNPLQDYDFASVLLRFFKGIIGWFWIVAILGFLEQTKEKSKLAKQIQTTCKQTFLNSLEHYAREAVLPFYILHQTVIVVIGFYVVQWHLGVLLKFMVISLASLTTTLLLYEIVVKRTRLTRFLFGMKS